MKRIVACIICLSFVFGLSSCNNSSKVFQTEKILAVKYASCNEFAAEEFVSRGFTKVTYNSTADVVVAVENGKADFGILNEFEYNSFILAKRNIQEKDICTYYEDYCAYFDSENQNLKELFDEGLAEIEADGTLEAIKSAHFNGRYFSPQNTDKHNGTLVMLCDPHFENRVYIDGNGKIAGLDVDIAREICGTMGYGLEIVTGDFDELFIKLQEGEGDFIITASQLTEERSQYYLASDIYFTLNYYLIEKSTK